MEISNRDWLVPKFAEVLREPGVALTLIDQGWMPRPWEMKDKFDLITSDFTYVRWLGDRKGIEEKTRDMLRPCVRSVNLDINERRARVPSRA